jgi:hypothetical protein
MMESTPSSASSSSVSASASAAAGIPTATTSGPNNNTNNTNTKEQHFTMVSNVSINTNISTSEKEEGPIPALTPNTPLTTAFNPTTPVNAMEMVPGSKDKNHAAGGYGNGHSENDSEARNNNVEDSSNVTPLTAVPAKSAEGDTCSSEPTTTQLAVNAPATGVGADSTAAALTVEPATSATVASAAENNNKEATAAADVEAVDPARLQALKAQAAGINSVAKVKLTDEAGLKQVHRLNILTSYHSIQIEPGSFVIDYAIRPLLYSYPFSSLFLSPFPPSFSPPFLLFFSHWFLLYYFLLGGKDDENAADVPWQCRGDGGEYRHDSRGCHERFGRATPA